MTSSPSDYVVGFLEGNLGLASGSLRHEVIPRDLADELTSVLQGAPSRDPSSPSIELRIKQFLAELEITALEEAGFFVRKSRWPNAAQLGVCLTHDVDNIERPMEHILKVKDRFSKADLAKAMKGELSLYDNLELIGKREGAEGFRSSFYLLSSNYRLGKVRPAARRLHSRGWEIGLHGDFGTHDSDMEMKKAVERLTGGVGIRPRGLREHYLRFDFRKSWSVMDGAGFDYDTTVGNNDKLGFKLGLATPFHPPDAGWRPLNLLELPLSLMDTTLWGYLKKGEEEGLADVMRLMAMVEEVEGLFTLLWHQEAVRMKGGRVYWLEVGEWRQHDYPWRARTEGFDAYPQNEAGDEGQGQVGVGQQEDRRRKS